MMGLEAKICAFPSLSNEEVEILKTLTHNPPGSGGKLDSLMILWLEGGRNNGQYFASIIKIDGEIVAWAAGVPYGAWLYRIGVFTRADKRKQGHGRIVVNNLLEMLGKLPESEKPIGIWYEQGVESLFGPLVVKHGFRNFQKYSSECANEVRAKQKRLNHDY